MTLLDKKRRIGQINLLGVSAAWQSPTQSVPSFEFALQSINSMIGTNHRQDKLADIHQQGSYDLQGIAKEEPQANERDP